MRHAELPFAMNASVRRITGVMCSMAMRAASKAIWKQSVGLTAARTQIGDSPLRPGLEQVGLLRLGGKTGGGTAALYVDHHKRELGHYSQTDTL